MTRCVSLSEVKSVTHTLAHVTAGQGRGEDAHMEMVLHTLKGRVHSPGHDQRGHQQVSHGQADHQVVGGRLEGPLPQHRQTHQHVPKHDGQDEQR
ncbi:hypothetical protein EYF80_000707 [Liparis tanakae]|uniref:Uncharacterized protein n=1 Tax=Liparis tanakae TaxID=230148 RepID=A0A4Z2JF74_9TELE|nr:hypothetical protein EYF80_000707 [Liparis tanakae]